MSALLTGSPTSWPASQINSPNLERKLLRALLVATLITVLSAGALLLREQAESSRTTSQYNLSWPISQTAVEVGRLQAAIGSHELQPSEDTLEAVQLWLDIVSGRIETLRRGDVGRLLASDTGSAATVEALHRIIDQGQEVMGPLAGMASLLPLMNALSQLHPQLLQLAALGHNHSGALAIEEAARLLRLHRLLSVLLAGLVFCALASVLFLASNNKLVRREHDAVQSLIVSQRRSHDELEVLVDAMPGALMRFRRHGQAPWRIVFIAPLIEALTGYAPAQIAPGWLEERLDADNLGRLLAQLDTALVAGAAALEFSFRHSDGQHRLMNLRMRAYPTTAAADEVVAIWMDVTREREMERQLFQVAKMAHLGEMATGIAHELNQPLAVMSLAAENALSAIARLPATRRRVEEKLEIVVQMVMRARQIVDHMRIFGRISSDDIEPVDIGKVIADVRLLLADRLHSSDVTLHCAIADDMPMALAKAVPLEQVIINIVANACDAFSTQLPPQPKAARRIAVALNADESWLYLTISDNAGGIPDHVIEKIFEPFFTTKAVGEGTGLGLSLSYGIIAGMDGSLAASNKDGGACFTVRLCRAKAASAIATPSGAR